MPKPRIKIRLLTAATLLAALTAIMLSSCSTTRRIPADETLYTGIKKIKYQTDSTKLPAAIAESVSEAVDVAPNNYWKLLRWRYPFPLGLWVYNNWSNPPKGLKHWLYEKLVEEPVLVSDVRPEVRTKRYSTIRVISAVRPHTSLSRDATLKKQK